MTMTIDISPEMQEKLEAEAARRKQTPEEYARAAVEKSLPKTARAGRAWSEIEGAANFPLAGEDAQAWVTRTRHKEEVEQAEFAEWKSASARTLQEVWNNDKDAVYDRL